MKYKFILFSRWLLKRPADEYARLNPWSLRLSGLIPVLGVQSV